jgi:hypothetical protein
VDAAPASTALLCASQGSSKPRKLPFPSVELAPVSPLLLSGSLGYTYGRPLSTAAYPPPKCLTAARAQGRSLALALALLDWTADCGGLRRHGAALELEAAARAFALPFGSVGLVVARSDP